MYMDMSIWLCITGITLALAGRTSLDGAPGKGTDTSQKNKEESVDSNADGSSSSKRRRLQEYEAHPESQEHQSFTHPVAVQAASAASLDDSLALELQVAPAPLSPTLSWTKAEDVSPQPVLPTKGDGDAILIEDSWDAMMK